MKMCPKYPTKDSRLVVWLNIAGQATPGKGIKEPGWPKPLIMFALCLYFLLNAVINCRLCMRVTDGDKINMKMKALSKTSIQRPHEIKIGVLVYAC